MQVLVATDGGCQVDEAARFAHALAGPDGSTTVVTIVPIPRQMIPQLREQWGPPENVSVTMDAEYGGPPDVHVTPTKSWPGDDAVIEQYLGNKRIENCKPVVEAIRALGGTAESAVREGTEISRVIMDVAEELDADAIVVGSHGKGSFQGLLGSTGSKLVRRAKRPVVVLR